jgi:hypothetical protein
MENVAAKNAIQHTSRLPSQRPADGSPTSADLTVPPRDPGRAVTAPKQTKDPRIGAFTENSACTDYRNAARGPARLSTQLQARALGPGEVRNTAPDALAQS